MSPPYIILVTAATGRNCPTWHYLLNSNCVCGSTLNDVVFCNGTTGEVGVQVDYCLTSDGDESVVGRCLAEDVHRKRLLGSLGSYSKVISNPIRAGQQHLWPSQSPWETVWSVQT